MSIRVYKKPIHTDQYLHRDNHHHLLAKYSVMNTLHYRAKAVSSLPDLLRTEKQHLREVLTKCKYPLLALDRMECKSFQQNNIRTSAIISAVTKKNDSNYSRSNNYHNNNSNNKSKGYIVIPYMHGLGSFKNICSKYGGQNNFKGNRTLMNILVM